MSVGACEKCGCAQGECECKHDTVTRIALAKRDNETHLSYWIRDTGRYNGIKLYCLKYPDPERHCHWEVRGGSGWICMFQFGGRSLTTPFFMGSAYKGEPSLEDVLSCLLSEYISWSQASCFEDWAGDYGFDTDSVKAQEMWDRTDDQSAQFVYVMTGDVIEELKELVRYE